jgi:hypothetical protein
MPITMAARFKACTIFARWNTGAVGSNPTQSIYVRVCVFYVCIVLYVGSGLATGWSLVRVQTTVYRIKNLDTRGQGS